MPDLCPSIADLDVLADLVRRRNNKLRVINGSRDTDSVPGHHLESTTQRMVVALARLYGTVVEFARTIPEHPGPWKSHVADPPSSDPRKADWTLGQDRPDAQRLETRGHEFISDLFEPFSSRRLSQGEVAVDP